MGGAGAVGGSLLRDAAPVHSSLEEKGLGAESLRRLRVWVRGYELTL